MTRFASATLIAALLSFAAAAPAYAQAYPDRPIRVIGSSSPGGISDVFIRVVGEELHKRLGQPLVVENRARGRLQHCHPRLHGGAQ